MGGESHEGGWVPMGFMWAVWGPTGWCGVIRDSVGDVGLGSREIGLGLGFTGYRFRIGIYGI